ncbi:MAG: hypothetical protein HN595_08370 [Flavobacteriaceae bacterium]|jgi:hypothetical protein|nr:hypothetical protein [Flavobacteriaceae bacterium]
MNNIKLSSQNSNNTTLKQYLKDICVLDTTYRKKHDTLNTIYYDFLQKNIMLNNNESKFNRLDTNERKELVVVLDDLNNQIRTNNENLYKHRMNVVKYIKDDDVLTKDDRKSVSDYLINMFNTSVGDVKEMKCCLEPYYDTIETKITDINIVNMEINNNNNNKNNNNNNKGVDVGTLDKAYLDKHNELSQMFKAYQVLYKKVAEYKSKLDHFDKLATSQLISEGNMKKLLDDQKYMMQTVSNMQEDLVNKKVLEPEERIPIPIEPIVKHPNNIQMFNNGIKEQINGVIERNKENKLDQKTKNEIVRMLKEKQKYKINKEILDKKEKDIKKNMSKKEQIILMLNKNK